ncbi:hypothetical protein Cni_G01883 [Canna indica]|uniref:Uncharacterized protein n=1 Tax=Canna indica TaxID=4628 RepID=A0AAQ3Q1N4_9LILI|nr:hypothetical protein Cni_G01883 [Canna indica]
MESCKGRNQMMEANPLISEAIALTEKKVNMTLDDLIKMSKKNASKRRRRQRWPIKSGGFQKRNAPMGNIKVQQYIDSRSLVRQDVLAQRRTNFGENEQRMIKMTERKPAAMPIHSKAVNRASRTNFGENEQRMIKMTERKPAAMPIHSKAVNRSQPRFSTSMQRQAGNGSCAQKGKVATKQKPQTLDALFSDMKEQRMRMTGKLVTGANWHQTAQWRNISQARRGRVAVFGASTPQSYNLGKR